jgi:hypothetical protein
MVSATVSAASAETARSMEAVEFAVTTVTRMVDEDWHSLLNDPLWFDLKPVQLYERE